MRKEYYHTYKKLGICTSCGKEKAEKNRTTCLVCSFESSSRKRNYDKARKSYYNKRKRELCKAFGICTTCMKREVSKGQQCLECYIKRKRKYKEDQLKKGNIPRVLFSEMNLCSLCGDPVVEGKKLCEKHLVVARKNAANARKYVDMKSHKWKQYQNSEVMVIQKKYSSNGI